jgi:hypothetical protein
MAYHRLSAVKFWGNPTVLEHAHIVEAQYLNHENIDVLRGFVLIHANTVLGRMRLKLPECAIGAARMRHNRGVCNA